MIYQRSQSSSKCKEHYFRHLFTSNAERLLLLLSFDLTGDCQSQDDKPDKASQKLPSPHTETRRVRDSKI